MALHLWDAMSEMHTQTGKLRGGQYKRMPVLRPLRKALNMHNLPFGLATHEKRRTCNMRPFGLRSNASVGPYSTIKVSTKKKFGHSGIEKEEARGGGNDGGI